MSSEAESSANHTLSELKKHVNLQAKASILDDLTVVKESSQCMYFWKYFEKHGGLKLLVQLLRYQDLKIINLALSILANACINPDSRQQVRNTDIVKNTLRILDLKVNDNLHCRVCRLIGNLADCSYHAKAFYDAGVVKKLLCLLDSKLNTATQLMGVRALRNIWSSHDESRQKIIESGIIKVVTTIFVESEKKPRERKYLDLTETCLKAILAFLSTNIECAPQIEGTDSNGFQVLIIFCENHNKLAIKCLCKLATSEVCRPSLGNAGAVETIVKLINSSLENFADLIYCLHLFSFEAINRHRIHMCSGLQLILDLLKKEEHEKYHHFLMGSLTKFLNHEKGMYTMMDNGVTDVLAENLKRMVISLKEKEADDQSQSKKRSRDKSPLFKTEVKYFRVNGTRSSADYPRDDWSPKSGSSGACTPPYTPQTPRTPYTPNRSYTPPFSPLYTPLYTPPNTPPRKYLDADFSCQNEEEIYSPVCSDNEWSEEELQEEIESIKSFSSSIVEKDDGINQEKCQRSQAAYTHYLNENTILLLNKLSLLENPNEKLVDPSLIEPLTMYVKLSKKKKGSQILMRIIQNHAYLLPLVKQEFVFKAQNLDNPQDYTRLLGSVAETGGGEGELSSILLRGHQSDRFIVAVSIPYLIKSKEKLQKLLCKHGALPLLFETLSNDKHSLHEEAVEAVCQLAYSLHVRPDILDKSLTDKFSKPYDNTLGREVDYHAKPATVTLELDDGTTIEACRMTLCQRSEVFSNLLEGSFSEAGKRRVRLKKTSSGGLRILLLAIDGSTNFEDQEIDSLLDAVVLADQFLMADISEKLSESSMAMLSYKNLCKAWVWSRNNKCQEFKNHCVKSFLVNSMTRKERLEAFKDFSGNDNFEEFLDEIKEIISAELEMR